MGAEIAWHASRLIHLQDFAYDPVILARLTAHVELRI